MSAALGCTSIVLIFVAPPLVAVAAIITSIALLLLGLASGTADVALERSHIDPILFKAAYSSEENGWKIFDLPPFKQENGKDAVLSAQEMRQIPDGPLPVNAVHGFWRDEAGKVRMFIAFRVRKFTEFGTQTGVCLAYQTPQQLCLEGFPIPENSLAQLLRGDAPLVEEMGEDGVRFVKTFYQIEEEG
jgi:hypothetical protein